jgi:hypothetical protein
VRKDLERRLRAVEAARTGGIEFWVSQGDGTYRGPQGEQITGSKAEVRCRRAGKLLFFCTQADMDV